MEIKNTELADIENVFSLYEMARDLQRQKEVVVWPHFNPSFIEAEILQKRQWKLLDGGILLVSWVIAFDDKEIWGEKECNDAIYVHRVCSDESCRGKRLIDRVVSWAVVYAKQLGKRYIRLDTLGNNVRLIQHYTSAGFTFLGMTKLTATGSLPRHYQNEPNCCLFEIDLLEGDLKGIARSV